jgi:regulator of sirC expression with transglutaminase-like and TPR domain
LALTDCDRLIELKRTSPSSYAKRAYIKCEIEDYLGAIQDLNSAIELAPSDASYYL